MQKEMKSELSLKNRCHKVDMPRNERPDDAIAGDIGLTEPEPNASFTLPMKRKWYGKRIPPKGTLWFEIELIGQKTIQDGITDEEKTLTDQHFHECPITCILNSERRSCGRFQVNSCNNYFTLYFDASRLKDCPVTLDVDRKFYLPFRLTIKDLKKNQPIDEGALSFDDYMEITVKKYEPTILFEFRSSDALCRYTTDRTRQYQQVGTLKVSHSARFSCSPKIINEGFTISSSLDGHSHNDRIYLRDDGSNKNQLDNLCFNPCDEKEYSVILDMTAVNNPCSSEKPDTYGVLIDYKSTRSQYGIFQLLRNPTLTCCKAAFELPTNNGMKSLDLNTISEHEEDLWLSRNNDQIYTLKLCFANTADAVDPQKPNAAVLVWGVSIDAVDTEGGEIHTRDNRPLNDIFSLNGNTGPWALNSREGEKSAKCELPITLEAGQIESITPAGDATKTFATICLHLTYYMLQDETGKYFSTVMNRETNELDNNARHSTIIKIRLIKDPQPGWMCVDFGTSAVVAAYAKGTGDDTGTLINLKEIKRKLLEAVYPPDSPKLDINDEDDYLISSTICFNKDNNEVYDNIISDGSNYLNLPVWFSPSAAGISNDYLLPCLKTIMGYRQLPNIFLDQHLKQFKYRTKEKEVNLIDNEGRATALMRVSEVSKVIYRQLFTYYLALRYDRSKEILIHRNVNKLVLSVPNTFTPINIATVKRLAREAMPEIYPEHLRTVSESDAVACYYVAHHDDFLNNSDLTDTQMIKLQRQERVLVFDMGAGTLDLTWFEKKEDGKGKTTVTIKGKLGVSKAGNYLDYELGHILQEFYSCDDKQQRKHQTNWSEKIEKALIIDRSESNDSKSYCDLRLKLKNYVKELKKSLSNSDATLPTLILDDNEYPPLKVDEILNNRHFKNVIREMTADVLQTFGKRYNKTAGKLDIDVVIFSGRSTSLKAIRESVKENVRAICTCPDKLFFADICARKLQKDIDQASGNESNITLKTIVTEGALAYASLFVGKKFELVTKPFYASYGLMKCGRRKGSYEYVPLIDDNTPISGDGKTIESLEIEILTEDFRQIDLIQSYSCDPVADYQKGHFETISKLYEETISEGRPNFSVQLTMNIQSDGDENVGLIFKVGQGTAKLDAHDDFNNDSLRKSLWPVIFDNKKDVD